MKQGIYNGLYSEKKIYSICSKISNATVVGYKKVLTNRVIPDQTASEEAVWSGSSLLDILACILLFALITNILFKSRKRKVFKILEHLPQFVQRDKGFI